VEVVGAARAAAEILQRFPQANVVLVRTRGIWGSMFSFAQTGRAPNLIRCLLRGLGWLLASLVFFAPRRKVTMTVEVVDRASLPELSREKLNPFLEQWYNAGGLDGPTFVPYHFLFGPRTFQFPEFQAADQPDLEKIKRATMRAVNEMVEEHLGRPLAQEENRPDATLDQIGLDSLDRMDIALEIEDRFGFRSDRVAHTLGELWALAEGLVASSGEAEAPVPALWNRPPGAERPTDVLAETIAEFKRHHFVYE